MQKLSYEKAKRKMLVKLAHGRLRVLDVEKDSNNLNLFMCVTSLANTLEGINHLEVVVAVVVTVVVVVVKVKSSIICEFPLFQVTGFVLCKLL